VPTTIQEYLAAATEKAASDLVAAFDRLPEDKRDHEPADTSRSALDQLAECVLLNGYIADTVTTHAWPPDRIEAYMREKVEYGALDSETLRARLHENTQRVAAAIRATPDEALPNEIQMPWGPRTVAQIIGIPLWNMTYHLGQINYIASLLGCLA